jgi:hypothetical protein
MVSITLSVPGETREIMKKFPEVNWSALVRKEIIRKAAELEIKEEMLKQLSNEEKFSNWAVSLVRKGRSK